jgi:hypothetical protein
MALELLSGPNLIADGETEANILGITYTATLWVDPVGIIAFATGGSYLIQMDGTGFKFAQNVNNLYPGLALIGGNPSTPNVGEPWYSCILGNGSSTTPANEWALDHVTHARGPLLSTTAPGDQLGAYAHLPDRFLALVGAQVRYTANAADTWHVEATLAGFGDGAFFSWARERGHLWLGSTTGKIVRYDYVNHVASSPVYQIGVASAQGLFYSAKHDVFVSVRNTGGVTYETFVWARTPLPASIAAPTASPSVAAGRVSTLTTRVLGADSEACPNEVVSWALTGEGELDAETSATDADGYATNRLVLPVDAAGPNVQVDVELATP